MRLIDRYLISIFARLATLCICSFTAIYLVIDFLEKIGGFSKLGAPINHILAFFFWKTPAIVNQAIPLSVLMATILTIGTISRSSELVAMQSAGISLPRIAAPLLGCSILLSLVLVASSELLLPTAVDKLNYTEQVLINRKPATATFRQDNIWYRDNDTLLRARKFDPERKTLTGVTVWRIDHNFVPTQRIDAASGQMVGNAWELKDAVRWDLHAGGVSASTPVAKLAIPLDLRPSDLKNAQDYAENLSFTRLRQYVAKLKESGYDARRYETLMHARLAQSFAPLVMASLGIPFALRSSRSSGIAKGVGLSMLLGFAYFVTNAIFVALGQSMAIPALLAGWSANLLFLALGCWLTMDRRH